MEIGNNRAAALYAHLLALEKIQEAKDDAAADYNERKKIAKEDGFDTNVLEAIKKRRKNGEGQTIAFDRLLREYEEAIEVQRDVPLLGPALENIQDQINEKLAEEGLEGVSVTITRGDRPPPSVEHPVTVTDYDPPAREDTAP